MLSASSFLPLKKYTKPEYNDNNLFHSVDLCLQSPLLLVGDGLLLVEKAAAGLQGADTLQRSLVVRLHGRQLRGQLFTHLGENKQSVIKQERNVLFSGRMEMFYLTMH